MNLGRQGDDGLRRRRLGTSLSEAEDLILTQTFVAGLSLGEIIAVLI